ncbi:MAG: hypothetical protein ACYCO0_02845, partial [Candidatus Micrarchaeaceae archaeon]
MDSSHSEGRDIIHAENDRKLRLYAGIAIGIVALAVLSILFVPSGTGQARCSSIASQSGKNSCIESAAISSRNSSLCGSLAGAYADQCYLSIAENTSNQKLCGKINDSNTSGECYVYIANYTKDPQLCSSAGSAFVSQCAYHIAVMTNSTAACSLVNGTGGQLECNATIDFAKALHYGKPTYCANIKTNNNSFAAYGVLQNVSLSDYSGLGLNITQLEEYSIFINRTIGARDLCYLSIAYQYKNSTYCSYVQDSNLSDACLASANPIHSGAVNKSNATLNASIIHTLCSTAGSNTTSCQYGYMSLEALQTGNLSICKGIPSPYSYTC